MKNLRPQDPTRWDYPETRTYLPAAPDERRSRFSRPRQPTVLVFVTLVAATGVALLAKTSGADTDADTSENERITAAVHEELQKMFLADMPPGSRVMRSGTVAADTTESVDHPQGSLAVRCYGTGYLSARKFLTDGTTAKATHIRCGGSDLTLISGDATVRTITVTPNGTDTWASWALTHTP
ncbi:hypothetical protein ACF1BS_08385 [Streptomyces sp. NPDC014748]|uniref:hypothetical protein n=1 Tax=unclassified Streptomyces TaxID=2593676 RepID=UPI001469B713|nr:hypothetical protein [Streptomyces sp. GMY02]NMO37451.1 hypothetical protein [Streptomyces sp. GMY02]